MAKAPTRSMQKFLERRKKEKELNAVDNIILSSINEFKQAFAIIDKRNTGKEILLLECKNNHTDKDIQDFIYDFLDHNFLAHDLNISVLGSFVQNSKFKNYCKDNSINIHSITTKKMVSHYNTIGKSAIIEQRKTLLKELTNYKDNVMLYTDGSKKGNFIGVASIIDYEKKKEPIKLMSGMRKNNNSINFEISAIMLGLKEIIENPVLKDKKIIITMDSDYSNEVLSKIKEDEDLQKKYNELYELMKAVDFNIQTNVIKSHKNKLANTKVNIDFRFNKEVDELAKKARLKVENKKRLTI